MFITKYLGRQKFDKSYYSFGFAPPLLAICTIQYIQQWTSKGVKGNEISRDLLLQKKLKFLIF